MVNETQVIEAFNIAIEKEDLEVLKKNHTYISEKLILDAVNGVNIVAKDLNENGKSRGTSLRLWDGITGTSKKRQEQINENVIEGINACTHWLRDHDRHISRIDSRICSVANELINTQDQILKFYDKHISLNIDVDNLKEAFFEFQDISTQRLDNLESWIKDVDLRDNAFNLIDFEINRVKAGKYDHLAIPLQIYTILDNLKSGDVGLYYHNELNLYEKNKLKEHIENHIKNYLSDKIGKQAINEFINYTDLMTDTHSLTNLQKNAISLISTQHYKELNNPELPELISVISSYNSTQVIDEINKRSHIRDFFSLNNFISESIETHLTF